MDLTRILVATDFSPNSAPALELAADLARRFHASVDVLHVCDLPQPHTTAEMHRCVRTLQRRGIVSHARLESGDPALKIVEIGADYDLIVMGTHGRRGLERLARGSVAESVLRMAPCPVLTARSNQPWTEASHG